MYVTHTIRICKTFWIAPLWAVSIEVSPFLKLQMTMVILRHTQNYKKKIKLRLISV